LPEPILITHKNAEFKVDIKKIQTFLSDYTPMKSYFKLTGVKGTVTPDF
jgi:hypothetical protein